MSQADRAWRPADILSFLRPLLGCLVLFELSRADTSFVVLPAVVLACLSDYFDGKLARSRGQDNQRGALIDKLADGLFLALVFWAMALAEVWSRPPFGSALRYWTGANWLPLVAIGLSFSSYLLRARLWGVSATLARRSPRGHTAGVANYVLALVGGVAVLPGFYLSPFLLEPAFLTVALLNLSGAFENIGLLVGGKRAG